MNKEEYISNFINNNINEIINDKIYKIKYINLTDYYFYFLKSKKILHISFNLNFPFLTFVETIPSSLSDHYDNEIYLKKFFYKSTLLQITQINNDKLIKLTFKKILDNYESIIFFVYLELFTNHPNLIITNTDDIILSARHYTSLNAPRIINNNIKYEFPIKKFNTNNKIFDSINFIDNYENNLQNLIIQKDFKIVFKSIKDNIKHLNNKIINIKKNIDIARDFEIYKDLGDYIYTNFDNIKTDYIFLNNNKYELNKNYNLIDNANHFYKKYKKYKTSIKLNEIFLNETLELLKYFELINNQISSNYNSFEDIKQIYDELLDKKIIKNKVNFKIKNKSSSNPYVIKSNELYILYGKNNYQNDYLTFNIAKKDDLFIHIKDYPGNHIILKKEYINDKNIVTASKLSLVLSNKFSNDIQYTFVKNVKKTKIKGLVNLLTYKTIYTKIDDNDFVFFNNLIKKSSKLE